MPNLKKAKARDRKQERARRMKVHGRRIGELYANAIRKRQEEQWAIKLL